MSETPEEATLDGVQFNVIQDPELSTMLDDLITQAVRIEKAHDSIFHDLAQLLPDYFFYGKHIQDRSRAQVFWEDVALLKMRNFLTEHPERNDTLNDLAGDFYLRIAMRVSSRPRNWRTHIVEHRRREFIG